MWLPMHYKALSLPRTICPGYFFQAVKTNGICNLIFLKLDAQLRMKNEAGDTNGDSWRHQLKHTVVPVVCLCLYT